MRILISSHRFYPDIGGIENVTGLLAREWRDQGHHVDIVTQSPGPAKWEGLSVFRRPSFFQLRGLVRKADLYLQNHVSLRTLLPVLDFRKKITILHQTYLSPFDQKPGFHHKLKRWAIQGVRNLAISNPVAERLHLAQAVPVVGNPYDDTIFHLMENQPRARDLIFVGRL